MRASVVLCVALLCEAALGCDDRTTIEPPVIAERVIDKVMPVPEVTRADVLFVIDRSPAIAPYRDTLARQLGFAGTAFSTLPASYVDLHVGVVSADLGTNREPPAIPVPGQCAGWGDRGALLRSPLVDGPFITLRQTPAAQHTNVRGALASALPALAGVATTRCDRAQPLEAMRIALDANPHDAGFLRADALLFVIVVSAASDTSPGSLADYARFLHGVKSDPDAVVVLAATDDPRVRAFAALFPNRSETLPLSDPDLYSFAEQTYYGPHPFGPVLASPCFDGDLLDIDPDVAGVQPDCVVTEGANGRGTVMTACRDGAGLPCWRVRADPQSCSGSQQLALTIERGDLVPPDGAFVEAQCVAL